MFVKGPQFISFSYCFNVNEFNNSPFFIGIEMAIRTGNEQADIYWRLCNDSLFVGTKVFNEI